MGPRCSTFCSSTCHGGVIWYPQKHQMTPAWQVELQQVEPHNPVQMKSTVTICQPFSCYELPIFRISSWAKKHFFILFPFLMLSISSSFNNQFFNLSKKNIANYINSPIIDNHDRISLKPSAVILSFSATQMMIMCLSY